MRNDAVQKALAQEAKEAAKQLAAGAGAKSDAEKDEQNKSAVMIQANFRGRKERQENSQVSMRRARHASDPKFHAQNYIKMHKLTVSLKA